MENNLFKKLDLKNKIIASTGIVLFISFFVIYFLIIPTVNEISRMENDIESQRIDLEKKYMKGQSLKKLTENLKKIEPSLSFFDKSFISQARALEFITTIEGLSEKNKINQKINLLSENSTQIDNFYQTPLFLSINGDFNDFINYLKNLEKSNFYININSINISSSGNGKISADISADTFWK